MDTFNLIRHSLANIVIISVMRLHNNVVSFTCLSSVPHELVHPSYSVGKLTIRMIHVHIVVQYHS